MSEPELKLPLLKLEELLDLPLILKAYGPPLVRIRTKKRGGKKRIRHEPNRAMDELQKEFIEALNYVPINLESARGALEGHSALRNAEEHRHNRYFYIFDITSAYLNTPLDRVAKLLNKKMLWGGETEILTFLKKYMRGAHGGLAEGLNASPLLFNLYCGAVIDSRIRSLCEPLTRYTRYIDDLVISSPKPITRIFRKRVRRVVEEAGFTVSRQKSFVQDVKKGPVTITGATITRKRTMEPKDDVLKRLETFIRTSRRFVVGKKRKQFEGLASYLISFEKLGLSKNAKALLTRVRIKLNTLPDPPLWLIYRIRKSGKRWHKDEIETLLSLVDLEKLVGKKVLLKPKGKNHVGLCPFHGEKSPSFHVVPHKNLGFYHCFGCGAHGDAVTWVMETEGVSFPEAMRFLTKFVDLGAPT